MKVARRIVTHPRTTGDTLEPASDLSGLSRPGRADAWRLLLLFIALSLATRWLSLVVDVLDLDETAHAVGSWELMRGRVLYADFVDNKPPLVYLYYAFAQVVFGRGLFAVHLMTAVVTVPLIAFGISAFFHHRRAGLAGGVAFLVYSAAFIGHDVLASHTEILMLLPATWAIVLLRDEPDALVAWRAGAAGALVGVAALFKYPAVGWGLALAVAIAVAGLERRRVRATAAALLALALGLIGPPAITWLWFESRGSAGDLLYWTVANNMHYARNPISAREGAGRALAYGLPFLIVTGPLWWVGRRSYSAWTYRSALIAVLIVTSILSALLGLRFYPHYFIPLYVPLAIAAAPWIADALRRPMDRQARRFVGWTAFALAGFTIATAWLYLAPNRVYRERDPVFAEVGRFLREDPCRPGATLFVWGYAPIIYYYADMPAASRFAVLAQARLTGYVPGNLEAERDGHGSDDQEVAAHWDLLMRDLERSAATFIVDTAPAGIYRWDRYPIGRYPRLQAYVDERFELAGTVRSVRILRRRGCGRAAGRASRARDAFTKRRQE